MEDRDYLIILYDYYSELFNEQEKENFELYFFDNLSLSEISENEQKSRNAIHKSIKNVINKLLEYESKLRLYKKSSQIKELLKDIKEEEIKNKIEELLWKKNYQSI